jgi:major vault protein
MAEERKRELPLPPGTHAYVLDSTKGIVKLFVGPTVINQTQGDRPVRFNKTTFKFDECSLEESLQQNLVVPEGFYAVLTNPAKDRTTGKLIYPGEGQTQATPDLAIGLKENIPGPVNFALFPGQTCEVRRGHQLRSNEYLRIKIYNEDKAKENWSKAVIKVATSTAESGEPVKVVTDLTAKPLEEKKVEHQSISAKAPADLVVGKQYNILGTEVAFYIPPTGVSVVPEGEDTTGKEVFVRQAETLEQLEYSILVDENGNKDYPKGPSVVFPKPTQEFLVARKPDGSVIADENGLPLRKFKAIEMNSLQGIQLKFAKNGELVYANGDKEPYSAGDEKFITGAKMPIYYPEEGHTLVRYDGKTIHYAVAVTEGEAKYVLVRETGDVKLVPGPTMLLPDPVKETIVWRPLSEREARTWFPGSTGHGSPESIAWNEKLRQEAGNSPTTRQGVVSEGQLDKGGIPAAYYSLSNNASPEAFLGASMERGASYNKGVQTRARSSSMQESRQGKDQQAVVGDVAERKSTYNEPRTIILGGRVKGVPTIKVQPGYAVNVIKSDGRRDAVVGPKTVLMGFSDTLDILRLSTGKPKNTDRLFETVYLNVYNNKVTDIIDDVETSDHVVVSLKLIYTVNFEGDASKWFTIENYVKHLCDHVRSVLKGAIRKLTIEEFYRNSSDIIRDIILGVKAANVSATTDASTPPATPAKRAGMFFAENGMRITDVDALKTQIADASIAALLAKSQQDVVRQNIELGLKQKALEVTQKYQTIERLSAEAVWQTEARKLELEAMKVDGALKLSLAQVDAEKSKTEEEEELQKLMNALEDLKFTAQLNRNIAAGEATEALKLLQQNREIALLDKQVEAVKAQMLAVQPGLIEALTSVSAKETLIKVASEMSFHQMFGADNAVDFIQKTFAGTPLQGIIDGVVEKAALAANGTVKNPNIPQSQA